MHPVGVADKRKEVLANLFISPNLLKNSQLFLNFILTRLKVDKDRSSHYCGMVSPSPIQDQDHRGGSMRSTELPCSFYYTAR